MGAMRTIPTGDMEALTGLPSLDLVNQGEARSAAHRLWSLGCWSYLHPSQGHSSLLMWLQRSDPIFNMGVDITRPVFNLEPQYKDTTLTRKEWTRGPGTPPVVNVLVWLRDWSRLMGGTKARLYGQSLGRRLSNSLEKHATVSQAEVHAILECVNEIQLNIRPEKYVSICSDSQAALKALQATKTTSPLVRQCQNTLNYISNRHTVGLYWVPGHAGVRGNKIANRLATVGSFQNLSDMSHPWGVSINNKKKENKMLGG